MSDGAEALPTRLRRLPAVNRLVEIVPEEAAPRARVTAAARQAIADARVHVLAGGSVPSEETLIHEVLEALGQPPSLRPATNATGVVLHTGLGRAALARAAVENLNRIAGGHSTLEIDVETGLRGSRLKGAVALLRDLVGCEDALVVNNNAAAVLLALRVLAAGREVVISRGQLVEIGGQFRIPDVIAASGARLVEVGATNKTHLSDYARAIHAETALLLHVHPSNFRVVGFTAETPLKEMADLAREHGVPSMADLGSGALIDLTAYGAPGEPTVQSIHATGVDICTWSGDKLLGGPQCGVITGRGDLVARMKQDPMMRALRVDKLILAALEATLRLYRDPETAREQIPTIRAITRTPDSIREAADRLRSRLEQAGVGDVEVQETLSQVGGGSLPGEELRSWAVRLDPREMPVDTLAKRLRTGQPAIFGRVARGALLLDLRTVAPEEEDALFEGVLAALSES
ncbi:MAG TPA: L-seryl-tRNA(Sec) selenium transferase [Armatimonadota bacterium]|nr:L-seryl-tRNA(Sec) selenium transferase [Armatimonadota bacterium]